MMPPPTAARELIADAALGRGDDHIVQDLTHDTRRMSVTFHDLQRGSESSLTVQGNKWLMPSRTQQPPYVLLQIGRKVPKDPHAPIIEVLLFHGGFWHDFWRTYSMDK
jgi:hypothetical protein